MTLANAIKLLSKQPGFDTFIRHILTETQAFSSTFDTDPLLMAYKSAKQEVGLDLLGLLNEELPEVTVQNILRGKEEEEDEKT